MAMTHGNVIFDILEHSAFQDVLLERWGKNRRGSKLGDSDASEASNGASAISQWVPIGWLLQGAWLMSIQ